MEPVPWNEWNDGLHTCLVPSSTGQPITIAVVKVRGDIGFDAVVWFQCNGPPTRTF